MAVLVLMASWLTPTTLFLFLNLMIGTIVIASRSRSGSASGSRKQSGSDHFPNPAPLARAPSLIDRVKSINLNLYQFPPHNNAEPEFFNGIGLDHYPAPLARAPSLLDRVKSINLSYFKFPQYNLENDYAQTSQPTVGPTRIDRVGSTNLSQFEYPQRTLEYPEASNPTRIARAPSLIERVKSIDFFSFYRSEPTNTETHFNQATEPSEPHPDPNPISASDQVRESKPRRSKSERNKKSAKASEKMKKSASEKSGVGSSQQREEEMAEEVEMRRPATARVERSTSFGEGEQSVDAKAADFINKFKQQLKLQRLDSILRYKETLKANQLT